MKIFLIITIIAYIGDASMRLDRTSEKPLGAKITYTREAGAEVLTALINIALGIWGLILLARGFN